MATSQDSHIVVVTDDDIGRQYPARGMTMQIKRQISVTRTEQAQVLNVRRCGPSERLREFTCTACGAILGVRPWGLAFVKDERGERGMRLCEECLNVAEQELE